MTYSKTISIRSHRLNTYRQTSKDVMEFVTN